MGRSYDVGHEAETELEREGNCAHSPLLRPSQDNSDLAAEQCVLGEVRPHLQGVSIPTLPVVDIETIEEKHANVAHEAIMIGGDLSHRGGGRVEIGGTSGGRRSL